MLAVFLAGNPVAPSKVQAQPGISVSFQVFFNSLSPYGRWSNHPQYGSVWFPSVDRGFHPYSTNGRWVMTEYGNTWVSDYDWGWAPFHYGRWFYDDFYGWAWVPDYTWGPGWVNWRTGGGYYGWAPLLPGLQVRLAVNIPIDFWIFVPHRHFMSVNWYRYCAPPRRVQNVYRQTTIINNYYTYNNREYSYGPRRADVERYSRTTVPVYEYSRGNANGNYREVVTRSNRSNHDVMVARERSFEGNARVTAPRVNTSRSPEGTASGNRTSRSAANPSAPRTSGSNSRTGVLENRTTPRGETTAPARSPQQPAPPARSAPSSRSPQVTAPSRSVPERSPARAPAATPPASQGSSSGRVSPGTTSRSSSTAPAVRPAESRPTESRPAPSAGRTSGSTERGNTSRSRGN